MADTQNQNIQTGFGGSALDPSIIPPPLPTPPPAQTPANPQPPAVGGGSPTGGTPPSPVTPQPGSLSTFQFGDILSKMNDKVKYNNGLMQNRNTLVRQLYDTPPSPEDIAKLSPDVQKAIASGDKRRIEMELRLTNDQIQGRTASLDSSMKYLTDTYTTTLDQNEKQRQDAITNLLKFASTYGPEAGSYLSSLYTPEQIQNLKNMGIDISAFTAENVDPSAPGSGAMSVAQGLNISDPNVPLADVISQSGMDNVVQQIINSEGGASAKGAAVNNPGDIMYAGLPGQTRSGVSTKDGELAAYATPEAGRQAIADLVQNAADGKSSAYGQNPSLTQFMNKYSNTFGYKGVGGSGNATLQGMLAIYQSTGQIPPMGMGNSVLRQQFYAAIGADPTIVGNAVSNKAALQTLTAANRVQQTQYAANKTAINTLDKQLDLAKGYSDKVSRSDSPFVNKYTMYLNGQVAGDPETVAFQNIVLTASNEFAKILSGSAASIAGVTVSSAADAQKLLNASMSQGQFNEVLGLMKKEAQFRLDSQKETINSVNSDIRNMSTGGTADTGAGKGSLSDRDFVEQSLSSQNINYNDLIGSVPSGQIAVLDNSSGQVGFIPAEEYDGGKYTRV